MPLVYLADADLCKFSGLIGCLELTRWRVLHHLVHMTRIQADLGARCFADVKIGEYKETLSPKFEQDYKEMVRF